MQKQLIKLDGFSLGAEIVDQHGRPFRVLTRSTIVSDHKFDTSQIPNWLRKKGSRWCRVSSKDFSAHSKSDGYIVFSS